MDVPSIFKNRNVIISLLILVGIIILYLSNYFFLEYQKDELYKRAFEDAYNFSLECWPSQFIDNRISTIENIGVYTNFSLKDKIIHARKDVEKKYSGDIVSDSLDAWEYYKYKEGKNNDTESVFENYMMLLASDSFSIGLAERIYTIAKDYIQEEPPKDCPVGEIGYRKYDTASIIAIDLGITGVYATGIVRNIETGKNECDTSENKISCLSIFFSSIEKYSSEKRGSLGKYKEAEIPECPNTFIYKELKRIERDERALLENISQPFSLIEKSTVIDIYDACSEKIYREFIEKNPCPSLDENSMEFLNITQESLMYLQNCMLEISKNEEAKRDFAFNVT